MKSLKEGIAGFVRASDEDVALAARGLKAGDRCTIYRVRGDAAEALCALNADSGGGLNARIQGGRINELLVTRAGGEPLLYLGDDLPAFLWLLKREQKKAEPEKPAQASAPPPPPIAEPIVSHAKALPPPRAETYDLRDPGEGAPVDALPTLFWPEEGRQFEPYFERFLPVGMALPPGWRCVRVQPDNGPPYILGRRATEDRVDQVLFARKSAGMMGPIAGDVLRGADGTEYRALYRELSGAARSSRAGQA